MKIYLNQQTSQAQESKLALTVTSTKSISYIHVVYVDGVWYEELYMLISRKVSRWSSTRALNTAGWFEIFHSNVCYVEHQQQMVAVSGC